MKLSNIFIYRIEYEVPPSMENWTAIIAAKSYEEAQAYVMKHWGKNVNFISVGQQMALNAVSESVIAQIMNLGIAQTTKPRSVAKQNPALNLEADLKRTVNVEPQKKIQIKIKKE